MMFLLAIFAPPLYFLIKKRYLAFVIHGIVCALAIPMAFIFLIGIPMWVISAVCALWDLRKQVVDENTTLMATKLAQAIRPPTSA